MDITSRPAPISAYAWWSCIRSVSTPPRSLLGELLLDEPESWAWGASKWTQITLRLVAHHPSKQFEAGRRLRVLVIRALTRAVVRPMRGPRWQKGQAVAEAQQPETALAGLCSAGSAHRPWW